MADSINDVIDEQERVCAAARARNERALGARRTDHDTAWVSINDAMPIANRLVILFVRNSHGMDRHLMAVYVAPNTVECRDEYGDAICEEHYAEFVRGCDDCYLRQGWYEWSWYSEYGYIAIDAEDTVTHWRPLPLPPVFKEEVKRG